MLDQDPVDQDCLELDPLCTLSLLWQRRYELQACKKEIYFLLIWNHSITTGTMSGKVIQFLPKSAIKSYEECSRAVICLVWSIAVSRKYNLYESPIQQSRDFMKSGFMPASSSKTTAHTLMEWEEKRMFSSLVRLGWQVLATDWNTSAILSAVRYLTIPWWLTKTPIGWSSDWPMRFARR